MDQRTPWWKFLLAIALFIGFFFLVPVVFGLLLHLTNLFIPRAYQNTDEWIYVFSGVLGMVFACGSLEKILNTSHYVFCMIICIIGAFYSVAVAVWNFAIGVTDLYEFIGLGAEGIVATVFAIIYGSKIFGANRDGKDG